MIFARTCPGARLRDPADGTVVTVAAYETATDELVLTDGTRLPWRIWDAMEMLR